MDLKSNPYKKIYKADICKGDNHDMDTFFVQQMKNPPKTTICKADTGLKKIFMKEVLIINK